MFFYGLGKLTGVVVQVMAVCLVTGCIVPQLPPYVCKCLVDALVMRFLEKTSTHPPTPPSEKSQTSSWLELQWRLESSVQIRVLGCSVTFLSNYHEVPLGFEVSLCSGYSNEMECTMVS